jgi:hypothetical protein
MACCRTYAYGWSHGFRVERSLQRVARAGFDGPWTRRRLNPRNRSPMSDAETWESRPALLDSVSQHHELIV